MSGVRSLCRPALRRLALAGACFVPLAAAAQERIEVFVVGDQVITGAASAGVIHHVDALARRVEALSAGLPADPARAGEMAKARFAALTDAQRLQLKEDATVENLARQYRLTKTPAIVIDGRALIYGVSDVERARAIYRRWRAEGR